MARTLAIDRATAEVVGELDRAGIPSLLLKGPVLAAWLYGDGAMRAYGDSDILVPVRRVAAAGRVLSGLGFDRDENRHRPGHPHAHEEVWVRPSDGAIVELHWRMLGFEVRPGVLWERLWATSVPFTVAGAPVRALGEAARLLHVAAHAAQHGPGFARPAEDLRRALEQQPLEAWRRAAEEATLLGARPALTAALRQAAGGAHMADALGLPRRIELRYTFDPGTKGAAVVPLVESGAYRSPAVVVATLFPPAGFMRPRYAIARRGRAGLVLAYAQRIGRSGRAGVASLRSSRAARRRMEAT